VDNKQIRKELNLVSAEKSYNSLKIVCIVSIVCVSLVFCVTYIFLNLENKELASRIVYIDGSGMIGSGQVKSMSDKDIQEVQIKAAIKYAVPYLYSFNSSNFDENIEKGLLLFGHSGKQILSEYINQKVRERVLSSNLEVECIISEKDIELKMGTDKTVAVVVFQQTFSSGKLRGKRQLTVQMDIFKTKIATQNPFGYQIDNWVVLSEQKV